MRMTDKVLPFKRPVHWKNLRADEAEMIIRERARNTENIIFSQHAFERVNQRDILQPDVYRILREGYVDSAPERGKKGGWCVTVKKRIRGSREAAIVSVIFKESDDIIIVTVMWVDLK